MNTRELPNSPACERNKTPIHQVLEKYLSEGRLLEVGFGTGQHALYFCEKFPTIQWHAADNQENHWVLKERTKTLSHPPKNLIGPLSLWLDPTIATLKEQLEQQNIANQFDYIYTANTLHIMSASQVDSFCQQVADCLNNQAYLIIYGPFQFQGKFTSPSNQRFNQQLIDRNTGSCIKHFEDIERNLRTKDVMFVKRYDLPANNHILIFKKS